MTTPAKRVWSERMAVRFSATLVTNVLRAGLSFISGIIIARGLKSAHYGDLAFLLGSFASLSQLIDMETSSAFYTIVSRKLRTTKFFQVYGIWLVIQFVFTTATIAFLLPAHTLQRLWLGNPRSTVLLAFAASFLMNQGWGMIAQLGEARRKTVLIQAATAGQSLFHIIFILAAIRWGFFDLRTVMWLLVIEHLALIAICGPYFLKLNVGAKESGESERLSDILGEYSAYCKPLLIYIWVGCVYSFADRWLLQRFGGSQQQGFFAVGQQFATISLIATRSMLQVLWKETSEAQYRGDIHQMKRVYQSISKGLFFIGAWIGCLFVPYSREIVLHTMGQGYEGAWVCMAMMFLFPMHQSLGQTQGTFFLASKETKSYSQIGIFMMMISIPITYLALAPRSAAIPGLGLGAAGLASKLLVLQIVGVNLQMWTLSRKFQWKPFYAYQFALPSMLLAASIICKWVSLSAYRLAGGENLLSACPVAAGILLYAVVTLGLIYRWPALTGPSRDEVYRLFREASEWFQRIQKSPNLWSCNDSQNDATAL
jgi:O-antigen/teichoic acid export membrane protein